MTYHNLACSPDHDKYSYIISEGVGFSIHVHLSVIKSGNLNFLYSQDWTQYPILIVASVFYNNYVPPRRPSVASHPSLFSSAHPPGTSTTREKVIMRLQLLGYQTLRYKRITVHGLHAVGNRPGRCQTDIFPAYNSESSTCTLSLGRTREKLETQLKTEPFPQPSTPQPRSK